MLLSKVMVSPSRLIQYSAVGHDRAADKREGHRGDRDKEDGHCGCGCEGGRYKATRTFDIAMEEVSMVCEKSGEFSDLETDSTLIEQEIM